MRTYFDHAATSPMPPDVLDAYTAELRRAANPSSLHAEGQAARMRIEQAREDIARAVGASTPAEVVLTSGGTEADNLAIKGLWRLRNADVGSAGDASSGEEPSGGEHSSPPRPRILISAIEHPAVSEAADWLTGLGAEVVRIPVDADGRLDLAAYEAALTADPDRTALVSVMAANNEIGTVQPIAEVAALARAHRVPVHTDAVQAFGQLPLDFAALGVDAMTVTAHKIGGPVGIGALVLGRDLAPEPVLHGGGQERSVRSGTLDVAGAVAFAAAATAATADLPARAGHMAALRDRLIDGITAAVPEAELSGPPGAGRLPNNVHFVFPGCEGDTLIFGFDAAGFATSAGSACSAGVSRPSEVLLVCGRDEPTARACQRFTLGPETSEADVDRLLAALPEIVVRARRAGMASGAPA